MLVCGVDKIRLEGKRKPTDVTRVPVSHAREDNVDLHTSRTSLVDIQEGVRELGGVKQR